MNATLEPSRLVGLLLRCVPRPVVGLLDAWSRHLARQHAARRQGAWQRRRAAAAKPPAAEPVAYRLRPWRD